MRLVMFCPKAVLAFMFFVLPAAGLAAEAPRAVASIKPLHSLLANVMAGAGTPGLMIEGGQSPHVYAMRPSDARRLAAAQIVFWVGPSMESFLIRPLQSLPSGVTVVTFSQEPSLTRYPLRTRDAHEGDMQDGPDGHLWLDPRNAAAMARVMRDRLAALDPAHAALYADNTQALLARLDALDRRLAARLAPVESRPFVVFHDAYQYIEKRYGLAGRGALALSPELQPGARTVHRLRRQLMDGEVACAFAEPQFEPRLLITITQGTPARRGSLDSEGARLAAGPDFYETLMDNLGSALVDCLTP